MTPKRTAGILADLEKYFGYSFLTELWHGVQFGKQSGITCVEIRRDHGAIPALTGRDSTGDIQDPNVLDADTTAAKEESAGS